MYRNYIKRKEKIIINAIEVLDELGIQGLTTREIARREGITEPAIYRQFNNKLEIILAIMDRYSDFDVMIQNTILEKNMSPREAIFFYVESYSTNYQNYPQITTIMFSFDVFKYEETTLAKMKDITKGRIEFLTEIVAKGQETGEFDKAMDPGEIAEIIKGIMWSTVYRWKLDDTKWDLKERVVKNLKWILK